MVREADADYLKIRIYEDRLMMGADAARMIGKRIKDLLHKQDYVNMIFGAAPSQNETLSALITKKDIDWNRVNAFHMDEYVGLRKDAPQRFGNFLKERLFNHVPFHAVHYLDGNADDLLLESKRYSNLLRNYPADIVCMGIGENTHIAFNDPHVALFNDPCLVKPVHLDQKCRLQQVNDGCFDLIEKVPIQAITLTVPALFNAKYLYCMVPGKTKAKAVYYTLNSEIKEQYPSTILRKHKNAILYLDKDSSHLL
jgi:glucosamine-6-phosphate deaminase